MRISDWSSDVCSSDLHRLVKRRIDDLALARLAAMMERGERAHAPVSGGERVADRHPHARGGQVGITDDAAPAAHRLADAAETGARRIRTGLTVARHAPDAQPGGGLATLSGRAVPIQRKGGV